VLVLAPARQARGNMVVAVDLSALLARLFETGETYQDCWSTHSDDQDHDDDLTKEEPSYTRHRHNSPPKHRGGVITCLLLCWWWVEQEDIAKYKEDERDCSEHFRQSNISFSSMLRWSSLLRSDLLESICESCPPLRWAR